MANKYSEDMSKKIKDELNGLNCEDGGWNSGFLWKLRTKLNPRPAEPPTAMKNSDGVLLTNHQEIQKEAINYYEQLFKDLPIDPEYQEVQVYKEKLCKLRLQICAQNKTDDWTEDDLIQALKDLKTGTSRDPFGYSNELFKSEVAGKDLRLAVLIIMNKIKTQQKIPKSMQLCNITSIYKNKGSRNQFSSYRGIFRVTVLRNILDRLIYNDMYETMDSNLSDCNVGNRKNRNIRDNLFVLNAVLNSTKRNTEDPVDLGVYDVQKCFDTMWAQEALNDAYDLGFQNDKLPLVHLANKSAHIAVKSSIGTSERTTINNTIMQGTVWAGMLCTSTMDKLGKAVYENPEIAYKFRGKVVVPPLEMVDDVLTVSKCGATSVAMNITVNSFMSRKKLKLNKNKCAKIHIGKKCNDCPTLEVQGEPMKSSEKEKYLGDFINRDGKQHATIVDRLAKGYGIVANIIALVSEIPLGHRRIEIGLELRQAWFLNGILYNSEIWQKLTEKDKTDLMKIDNYLLKSIIGAQSKVPLEQLHLETGTLSIPQIIAIRRMTYLQTILNRPEGELIRNIFEAMRDDPIPGDWCEQVKNDFEKVNLHISEEQIRAMDEEKYKNLIKITVRDEAFKEFKIMQANHEKGKNIHHENLSRTEKYMTTNKLNNKEVSLLFNLRCQSINGIKDNFHQMFKGNLKCDLCAIYVDSQEHLLQCQVLRQHINWNHEEIKYDHIYGSLQQQIEVTKLIHSLLEVRDRLLEEGGSLPGLHNTGQL